MNDTAILDAPVATPRVKKAAMQPAPQQSEPLNVAAAAQSHQGSDHLNGLEEPVQVSRKPRKHAAVAASATHRPLRHRRSSSLARRQR